MSRTLAQILLTLAVTAFAAPAAAEQHFDFTATLRVDLHHVGDARREQFMLDELRREMAWAGSHTVLLDRTGYGTTLVELLAPGNGGAVIFSTTYCSLFGEWRTTDQAKSRQRVFSETVRMPMPRHKVRLRVSTRDRKGRMARRFEAELDPAAVAVSRERRRGGLKVTRVAGDTPPATSLDIVLLGDGYERWQLPKYRQDAARFARVLLSAPPFARHRQRINIWAVESPSRQSGVDEPRKGIFRDTLLSMSFNTFGSARYLMTEDNKAVRDVAANAPYDAIFIMSNTSRYGGGGIYNLYASFVSDNEFDEYVFVHEFGHSFAGLADEYYTSSVAYSGMYPRGVEPWEPNITAQTRRARVKWRDLIEKSTPVPSAEADPRLRRKVGLFEGAGYSAKGLYRAAVDCKMFGKAHHPFCPVCMRSVDAMIGRYVK